MSTFWTPGGEKPIPKAEPEPARVQQAPRGPENVEPGEADAREMAEMLAIQAQILATPCAMVVADHCMSLYELAALYLSPDPAQLDDAKVAIDSLAVLVDLLGPKLGQHLAALNQGLSQLRLVYVKAQDEMVKARSEAGKSDVGIDTGQT